MKVHLARIDDKVKRSLYIKKLSEKIGVDETAVLEKVRDEFGQKSNRVDTKGAGTKEWSMMEERILAMMLQFPDIIEEIKSRGVLDCFESIALKAMGNKIIDNLNMDISQPLDLRIITQDMEEQRLIASLSVKEHYWDYDGCLSLLNQFMSRRFVRHDSLLKKIQMAEEKNDQEMLIKLLEEKQRLVKENILH